MKLVDQIPVEIAKQADRMKSNQFYKNYLDLAAEYAKLIEKGVTRPRESQLRSVSDPPVDPMSISFVTVFALSAKSSKMQR